MGLPRRWDKAQAFIWGWSREGRDDVVNGDAFLVDDALRAEELREEREGQKLGVAPGLLVVRAEVPPGRLRVPLSALLEEVDELEGGREDFEGLLATGDQCRGAAS